MKLLINTLFSLALCACGGESKKVYDHVKDVFTVVHYDHPTPKLEPLKIDPALVPAYNAFLSDSAQRNGRLSTRLQNIDYVDHIDGAPEGTTYLGVCLIQTYSDGSDLRYIKILKDWSDNKFLTIVVYHELGHCLLDLPHTLPDSNQIMEPVVAMSPQYISDNWTGLVDFEFASEKK